MMRKQGIYTLFETLSKYLLFRRYSGLRSNPGVEKYYNSKKGSLFKTSL